MSEGGPTAVRHSFLLQEATWKAGANFPDSSCVEYLNKSLTTMPVLALPREGKRGFIFNQICNIHWDHAPGTPWSLYGSKNGSVIDGLGIETIIDVVLLRIHIIESIPIDKFRELDAVQLVQIGARDPLNVFVKNELVSQQKAKEGRWRLIFSSSLIDQIVDRYYNSTYQSWELSQYESGTLSVAVGLNRFSDGKAVLRERLVRGIDQAGTDVSAWDNHVTAQLILHENLRRSRIYGIDETVNPIYIKLARLICFKLLLIGCQQWQQWRGGKLPSGLYATASGNSNMRVQTAYCVAKELFDDEPSLNWFVTMGDDAKERYHPDLAACYAKYGFQLKVIERFLDGKMEFCSLNFFRDGRVEPSKPWKLLASFLANYPSDDEYSYRRSVLVDIELENCPSDVLSKIVSILNMVHAERECCLASSSPPSLRPL